MRNAKKQDLEYIAMDCMYSVQHPWYGSGILAHIKDQVCVNGKWMFAMETHDGCPIIVEYEWLRPVPRKEGTPAKPKRYHFKGSKPHLSNQVTYDPKLIKVGTKVLCRDKKIRTVETIGSDYISFVECHNLVDMKSGLGNYICKKPFYCDIIKIIIDKPVEKKDRYNEYEAGKWHFWQGSTNIPPVDWNVKVEIWVRCRTHPQTHADFAKNFEWNSSAGLPSDIIAFRIVKD